MGSFFHSLRVDCQTPSTWRLLGLFLYTPEDGSSRNKTTTRPAPNSESASSSVPFQLGDDDDRCLQQYWSKFSCGTTTRAGTLLLVLGTTSSVATKASLFEPARTDRPRFEFFDALRP
mmetsp:Transcript_35136/g.80254  ORF Transcript_35136/g.80254 Transcript_35136/m.80254 type:complete len:118 (-) Transcript_35136:200-553(-)